MPRRGGGLAEEAAQCARATSVAIFRHSRHLGNTQYKRIIWPRQSRNGNWVITNFRAIVAHRGSREVTVTFPTYHGLIT